MPKDKVNDPITDQEMAFARLILAGAMTDRQAAEAAGLNPDSAASTKSKPRVREYMVKHRADVQQKLAQQEAEGQHPLSLGREQVLRRLWELANLSPEMTRNSISGQVKAMWMIVGILDFIPSRRTASEEKKAAPTPAPAHMYASAWRRAKQAETSGPPPSPASAQEESGATEPNPRPSPVGPPETASSEPGQPTFDDSLTPPVAPPPFNFVPDLRVPFSIKKNPFSPFVRPR